jgi:hypothetical protein
MKERAAIDRHWAASAAGDQVVEHEIYDDDVVCEYPAQAKLAVFANQPSRFAAWRFLLCSLTTNRSFPLIRHDRTCSSVDFERIAVAPSDLEYNQGRGYWIAPIL